MTNKYFPIMRHIPMALVMLRPAVAVFLVFDALDGIASPAFVIAFILATITDMIDGVIARRLGVVSDLGSKMDSWADVILYGAILYCVWLIHPDVIKAFLIPILIVGSMQVASWTISLIKFRKLVYYHSYLAKFWAFTISLAVVILFAFNYAGFLFWLAIICGIVSNIEDIMITLIMPYGACDILTIRQALSLRREYIAHL